MQSNLRVSTSRLEKSATWPLQQSPTRGHPIDASSLMSFYVGADPIQTDGEEVWTSEFAQVTRSHQTLFLMELYMDIELRRYDYLHHDKICDKDHTTSFTMNVQPLAKPGGIFICFLARDPSHWTNSDCGSLPQLSS
ncbi:hypothetical protein SeMB42_g07559 [Synchytrium endobioticum]|uniref:Uncharacterized protein n=1 Tax=Synchytrium endobioticum TaxID=286115 RepID=A0A507BVN9_9FUNG|nr:hypothetical protein SeMB42_g07559 [Synchytrium endobioticum]